jgi:hypothetical protein
MITLPYEYRSGKTLLAELTPEHYITNKKKVVAKLTADNLWAKPVRPIEPAGELILLDSEYEELTADWNQFQQWVGENVKKHLAGKHDQRTHAGNRATIETPSFSDVEYDAISAYTGAATVQVNHKLRGLSTTRGIQPAIGVWRMSDEKIDGIVTNLDSAIGKSKLAKKTTLERDIPATSIKSGLFSSAVGKTISDKGYLSLRSGTTTVPPIKGFVKLRITAPAGTTALDMSFLNPNSMGEIIFPRGTKIKITSVTGASTDTIVRGEIVG